MEFEGFQVFPAADGRSVEADEQSAIGSVIQRYRVLEQIPRSDRVIVEVHEHITAGQTLHQAHVEWTERGLRETDRLTMLPQRSLEHMTPPGLVRVSVLAIAEWTPRMDSHYGYRGYYLSLLLSLKDGQIWDARGEAAK